MILEEFEQLELFDIAEQHQSERITDILEDIYVERMRQLKKWGVQSHKDGTHKTWEIMAESFKLSNDVDEAHHRVTWTGILLEEVYEAVSELHDEALRAELVQVAAVAAAWIEDIDTRHSRA